MAKHSENAGRFKNMCKTFDRIRHSYNRTVPRNQDEKNYPIEKVGEDYLITHLKFWISSYETWSLFTRTGHLHDGISANDDGRRAIPSTIKQAIGKLDPEASWNPPKVCITWIVCYIHNITPDETKTGWKSFDCSHCCINHNFKDLVIICITPACLCWESKSDNQSRGYNLCFKICNHADCKKYVCHCQRLHNPPCV